MKKDKKNKLRVLAVFAAGLLGACLYFEAHKPAPPEYVFDASDRDLLIFSEESGFYDGKISLELSVRDPEIADAEIYYSVNGDQPSVHSRKYMGPITLSAAAGETNIYSVKAVIYYNNEYTPVIDHTYVVAPNVQNRYFMNVVNISTDKSNLEDLETGIFTNWSARGDEWVRKAHVAIFDHNGNVLVNQDCGLATQGGTSAQFDVKSLKILANETWSPDQDSFMVDFFRDEKEDSKWSLIDSYHQIKLRSGSQDQTRSGIRSSLISRLAKEAGFNGITDTERCALYLNGDFYGIFDMQEQYSRSFLGKHYNVDDSDNIVLHKGPEDGVLKANHVLEYFEADLTVPENMELLESHVDMRDYLLYYAIEILSNNSDWPANNYAAWHYQGDSITDNGANDGRVRFLIYDTDLCFFYDPDTVHVFGWGNDVDIFEYCMTHQERGSCSPLPHLLENEEYKAEFLTIIRDLMNTAFATHHVLTVAQEEYDKIRPELVKNYDADWVRHMDTCYGELRYAIEGRNDRLTENIEKYLGLSDLYHLSLQASEGCLVTWYNREIMGGGMYSGDFYSDISFPVTATPYDGYEFSHWLVNGTEITDPVLSLSGQYADENGNITLEAVCVPSEEEALQISELATKGELDWIKITNVGFVPLKASDYFISDDPEEPLKFQLPILTLESGESILIEGKKNNYRVGDYQCNFNMNDQEAVTLTRVKDMSMEEIERIAIPRMNARETYGHYLGSPLMHFFNNTENVRYVTE